MPKGKAKKAELRSAKPLQVKLGRVDEIDEMFGIAYSNYEFALEYFYEGREKIIQARDVIRFEEYLYGRVSDEVEGLTMSLDDLGVEYPSELQNLVDNLDSLKDMHNEVVTEFDNLGINPMVDRV
jgi:hypothetical protein